MKKNVIWWPALKNPNHLDKYGDLNILNIQGNHGNTGVKKIIVFLYHSQIQLKMIL